MQVYEILCTFINQTSPPGFKTIELPVTTLAIQQMMYANREYFRQAFQENRIKQYLTKAIHLWSHTDLIQLDKPKRQSFKKWRKEYFKAFREGDINLFDKSLTHPLFPR